MLGIKPGAAGTGSKYANYCPMLKAYSLTTVPVIIRSIIQCISPVKQFHQSRHIYGKNHLLRTLAFTISVIEKNYIVRRDFEQRTYACTADFS